MTSAVDYAAFLVDINVFFEKDYEAPAAALSVQTKTQLRTAVFHTAEHCLFEFLRFLICAAKNIIIEYK